MNAIAYAYDQQVHVIIAKRQDLARQAAQARLAKGETETRGSLVTRVRGLAGGDEQVGEGHAEAVRAVDAGLA